MNKLSLITSRPRTSTKERMQSRTLAAVCTVVVVLVVQK